MEDADGSKTGHMSGWRWNKINNKQETTWETRQFFSIFKELSKYVRICQSSAQKKLKMLFSYCVLLYLCILTIQTEVALST